MDNNNMKLINKVKPEILSFLKSSIKPTYGASYRSIIASFKNNTEYRNLTIEEVDTLQMYLDNRFKPVTKGDFLWGDYLLKNQDKY